MYGHFTPAFKAPCSPASTTNTVCPSHQREGPDATDRHGDQAGVPPARRRPAVPGLPHGPGRPGPGAQREAGMAIPVTPQRLGELLRPRSVALVGAADK